jgi:hypothetical protein
MAPVGNLGLILCAFSYAGRMFLVVTADANAYPDIDVLMEAMETDWRALSRPNAGPPVLASTARRADPSKDSIEDGTPSLEVSTAER